MESADREERLVVRFALGLASLILAGAVLGALGVGLSSASRGSCCSVASISRTVIPQE
jgi:hypothetical protein